MSQSQQPVLVRGLGPLAGAELIFLNVIGGGIFILPAIVVQGVPDSWAILGVWLVGGALVFAGAMAYAELLALRPREGVAIIVAGIPVYWGFQRWSVTRRLPETR